MRRREVWNSTIWSLVKRWENSNRWTRWRCLSDFLLLQVIWHPWRVALEFYADFSSVNFDPLKLVRSVHRTSVPSIEASSINSIAPSPFLYWITIRKMAKISFLNQNQTAKLQDGRGNNKSETSLSATDSEVNCRMKNHDANIIQIPSARSNLSE